MGIPSDFPEQSAFRPGEFHKPHRSAAQQGGGPVRRDGSQLAVTVGELEKSRALLKSKDYAAARNELLKVLTGTTIDSNGKVEARKATIELKDAEVSALMDLAVVSRDAKDPYILPDIVSLLAARRRVSDRKESEKLIGIAHQLTMAHANEYGSRDFLGKGQFSTIQEATQRIVDAEEFRLTKDGMLMAQGFYHAMKEYGRAKGSMYNSKSIGPGAFALFEIIAQNMATVQLTDNALNYKVDSVEDIPTRCRESDKVDGYDPGTHTFTYRQECNYTREQTKYSSPQVGVHSGAGQGLRRASYVRRPQSGR